MPGWTHVRSRLRRKHAWHIAKLSGIPRGNLPASRKIAFQLFHLLKPKRASNVGQVIVESQKYHLIVPLACLLPLPSVNVDSVVSKAAKGLSKNRVVSRDHPAFAGCQMLHRMKTEDGHVCHTAHATAAILCA